MATDLLARIRSEIEERIAQLRPLVNEYERLTAAAERLAAVDAETHTAETHAAVDAEAETPLASPAQEAHLPPAEKPPSAPVARRAQPPRGSADRAIKLAMSLRTTPLIQQTGPRPAAKPAAPTQTASRVLEQPTPVPSAAEEDTWATSTPVADSAPKREPASPAAVRQAILAALEHGSHTASELVMVTAMSTPEIRGGLSRLAGGGAIAKVKRRGDGKTAYALPSARA